MPTSHHQTESPHQPLFFLNHGTYIPVHRLYQRIPLYHVQQLNKFMSWFQRHQINNWIGRKINFQPEKYCILNRRNIKLQIGEILCFESSICNSQERWMCKLKTGATRAPENLHKTIIWFVDHPSETAWILGLLFVFRAKRWDDCSLYCRYPASSCSPNMLSSFSLAVTLHHTAPYIGISVAQMWHSANFCGTWESIKDSS